MSKKSTTDRLVIVHETLLKIIDDLDKNDDIILESDLDMISNQIVNLRIKADMLSCLRE